MNLNKPTLYEFEQERKANNFCPPEASNSFYDIGNGRLNLFCIRTDTPLFDAYIYNGSIDVGEQFLVSGETEKPYNSLTVTADTELNVTKHLVINNGEMAVHGHLTLATGSMLLVNNGASVIFYSDSTLTVLDQTQIIVENGSSMKIYGEVDVSLGVVDSITRNRGIYLDSAAHLNVKDINIPGREHSMTDYEFELRSKSINPHTQGEYNTDLGRIGFSWRNGTPVNGSQSIELSVLWGSAVLGDYKLSVLGRQVETIKNLQIVESFSVCDGCEFYISDNYLGKRFLRPELYLGVVIGNVAKPGWAVVNGTMYVSGGESLITLDRAGNLTIGETGVVYLQNGACIKSTYNDEAVVLTINGELVIDDIEQLVGFNAKNITFGDNGKLVILNPSRDQYRCLLEIPVGIESSELYRLFRDNISHVEYHISANTGIKIDKYFEYYARDMSQWYGGVRFEKAVYDRWLVWHDGGVIELNSQYIPWVSVDCSLFEAARLFKSYSVDDSVKLAEVTKLLKYAGCGNIIFRFMDGHEHVDIEMNLESINMEQVINKPMTSAYLLTVDNVGTLFAHNMVVSPEEPQIINDTAQTFPLINGDNEIRLKV